jgi:hypothetical protein
LPPAEPSAGVAKPAAPDTRGGTLILRVKGGYQWPYGSLATSVPVATSLLGGWTVGGALGFGLSRHATFEIDGAWSQIGGADTCPTCGGSSIAAGLGFAYHLAQGFAIDPWASVGVGYRTSLITLPAGEAGSGRYHGIDFARIALGADFYPIPTLGFGPYIEGTFGSYRIRPDTSSTPSVYAFVQLGLRVNFDPLRGRLVAPPRTTGMR